MLLELVVTGVFPQEWYTVYEGYRRTNCVVSDLIMGNDYLFRVYAINMVGTSLEPCASKDSAFIQKTGKYTPVSKERAFIQKTGKYRHLSPRTGSSSRKQPQVNTYTYL